MSIWSPGQRPCRAGQRLVRSTRVLAGPESGPQWPGSRLTPSLLAGPSLALALAPGPCQLAQSTHVSCSCPEQHWPQLPQPLPRCTQPRQVCPGPRLPLTPPLLSVAAGTNPCSLNNGDCSQLCLPTSETSRSCMCTAGYSLKSGQQSCEGEHACPHPLTRITPSEQRDRAASPGHACCVLQLHLCCMLLCSQARDVCQRGAWGASNHSLCVRAPPDCPAPPCNQQCCGGTLGARETPQGWGDSGGAAGSCSETLTWAVPVRGWQR